MKESIGSSFLLMLVISMITISMLLIISFFTYSRAYKTKNKIVDIIEQYNGFNLSSAKEIDKYLAEVGYSIRRNEIECPVYNNSVSNKSVNAMTNFTGNYAYCVYEMNAARGNYYNVYVFMEIHFPLINKMIKLKVEGQSKVIYKFNN